MEEGEAPPPSDGPRTIGSELEGTTVGREGDGAAPYIVGGVGENVGVHVPRGQKTAAGPGNGGVGGEIAAGMASQTGQSNKYENKLPIHSRLSRELD